jgi:hypothetical protein
LDASEVRDAGAPDTGPPDSGWKPKGKDTCGDGVLEPGEACFGRTVIPEPHLQTFLYAVEDRNRDGRDDLVSFFFGNEGDVDGLAVFLNRGDGSLELAWTRGNREMFDPPWAGPGPYGNLFDFDNDGCLDFASVGTSSVTLWRCAEDGTFVEEGTYAGAYLGGRSLIADLGSDGTPDLIRLSSSQLIVRAFDGNTFEVELDLPLNDDPWLLRAVDGNGDGALDLLLDGDWYQGNDSRLLIPWSDGRPLDPIELPLLRGGYLKIVDLDGIPPIDFAVVGDAMTRLLVNHGGVLEELPPIASLSAGADIDFVHVDGDPIHELIELQPRAGSAVVRDLPSGAVLHELSPPFEFFGAHSRWDVDLDGIEDLIIRGEANQVHLRRADGSLADPFLFRTEEDGAWILEPLDADGDAVLDLAGDQSGVTLGRRQNAVDAIPDFLEGTVELWSALQVTDLGADGISDVVVHSERGALAVLRGDGQTLTAPEMQLDGVEAFDVALFDADLFPDFAIARSSSIGIARTDPSGALLSPIASVSLATRIDEVHAADLNGDGFTDVAYRTPGLVGTLLGDGSGLLQRGSTWTVAGEPTVLCVDLDTDGASEILVLGGSELVVLDARADLGVNTRVPAAPSTRFTAGDFDRDGDVDVAIVNGVDLYLLDADGSGGFDDARRIAGVLWAEDALASDIDTDGTTDLLIVDRGVLFEQTSVRVMLSKGGGLLTSRRFMTATLFKDRILPAPRLAVADINLDAAPDILTTRDGQVLVFYAYP